MLRLHVVDPGGDLTAGYRAAVSASIDCNDADAAINPAATEICDPGDVDEKLLLDRGIEAARQGRDFVEVEAHSFGGRAGGPPIKVPVREILDIAGDVDGQIYMRDFKLIDQSDMIVSLVPELPGGVPGLSSGVERELHHAFEHTKEVYVVWKPRKAPSPFISEATTKIFRSVDEALSYFESKGMMAPATLFGH